MKYNTELPDLLMREYGRNVQQIVENILLTPERDKRTAQAHKAVSIMAQLKNINRKKDQAAEERLWKHLFVISDFKLDVDSPYPIPRKEDMIQRPDMPPYPTHINTYRFYGNHIQEMIEKTKAITEPDQRKAYTLMIVGRMKKHFMTWNRGTHTVTNHDIIKHLEALSEGELSLDINDKEFIQSQQQVQNTHTNVQKKRHHNYPKNKKKRKFGGDNRNHHHKR